MLSKTVLMAGTIMMSVAVAAPAYADAQKSPDQTGTMATDDAMKSDAEKMVIKPGPNMNRPRNSPMKRKTSFWRGLRKNPTSLVRNMTRSPRV